ncbi:ATP phosphoribosyltransferase regulatory subunit [Paracoccus fistulariae]|uniref:ATP phosphoribosyltransferase regulatory subunit n=1 Tax=Paracoccus fistulariae TaxID=658446 RepID=A0ABY7SJY8_9RHOB|nr:ATP phosphoribosyltransferase regulatory subunit [Paracoccus fistulariae]MDB6180603.1 ATP phosphoribosyltransferase regulatory subunit [Paracoccus fistulariae]WCR07159.1 ATP phosphoribosyltransferase regulatory subunit [Paracoccus fistulariae]
MIAKRDKQLIGQRLLEGFRAAGAQEVAPDLLLPAGTMLDVYGEDIRARAYVTLDPIRGEVMLRPDFTVPVVQLHMESGAEPARYCYLGEVFRKQDMGDLRPENPRDNEYLQCGFELFAHDADADAEVFALFHRQLQGYGLQAETGDMSLLMDAVRGMPLPQARRDALLHHIWRPHRFQRLLDRFSRPARPLVLAEDDVVWSGLRGADEMAARIARLQADRDEPPLPAAWSARLQKLFTLRGSAPEAMQQLRDLSADFPAIAPAVARIEARFATIARMGIDPATIIFDASHGRATMEYYDGFTFSFLAAHADWPPVASGGRYDALMAVLGKGRTIPAVGGIIRPGLVAELEAVR